MRAKPGSKIDKKYIEPIEKQREKVKKLFGKLAKDGYEKTKTGHKVNISYKNWVRLNKEAKKIDLLEKKVMKTKWGRGLQKKFVALTKTKPYSKLLADLKEEVKSDAFKRHGPTMARTLYTLFRLPKYSNPKIILRSFIHNKFRSVVRAITQLTKGNPNALFRLARLMPKK